ncbi:MAG: tRNA (adenosine(37)-N6)-threonylcarbamoyltransferase complex ATPase subunit type 1 TsaE [Verrucomicrobiota bacterium]|nr:tRNA (adenosine(37)-N6)-threonylcarbamoyltransferase complex ATPase subunit type 1 TsaE [Verrucomicrobiota bacterium]
MSILERLTKGVETASAAATEALAAELAAILPVDATLALQGDLGCGKTTFVRGLARAWGITEAITSPTYTIFTIHQGTRQLIHMDAYRLEIAGQAESLLVEDFLRSPFCLAIEWPERLGDWVPQTALRLQFSITPDMRHRIVLVEGRG